jgi:hypothetical protein
MHVRLFCWEIQRNGTLTQLYEIKAPYFDNVINVQPEIGIIQRKQRLSFYIKLIDYDVTLM